MKDAIIYVPQGRGAYLTAHSHAYRIEALYTDQFSTCHILITVSAIDVTLFHLDALTNLQTIHKLISGITIEEIFVIHRGTFKALTEDILEKFQQWKPKIITIPDEIKAISVSHRHRESSHLHTFIKLWHEELKVNELLHHPKEKEFNTIQKIEQLIGFRSQCFRHKTPLVFAVMHWNVIDEAECRLDLANSTTKEDFEQFQLGLTYDDICCALHKVVALMLEKITLLGDVESNVIAIAEYLESYLYNYDSDLIFITNFRWLLDESTKRFQANETSGQDLALLKNIAVLLQNNQEVFSSIKHLMTEYIRKAPATPAKTFIVQKYILFNQHYQRRKDYDAIESQRLKLTSLANQCKEEGLKVVQNNKVNSEDAYKTAIGFFASQYVYLVHSQTIDDVDFASCNYNIGRCLQKRNEPQKALKYLQHALKLRQEYAPNSQQHIEKYQKAIAECMIVSQQTAPPQTALIFSR